jgi:hypothetical protein
MPVHELMHNQCMGLLGRRGCMLVLNCRLEGSSLNCQPVKRGGIGMSMSMRYMNDSLSGRRNFGRNLPGDFVANLGE